MARRRRKKSDPTEALFVLVAAPIAWAIFTGHGRWLVALGVVSVAVAVVIFVAKKSRSKQPLLSAPPRPASPIHSPIEKPLEYRSRREPTVNPPSVSDISPPSIWSLDLILVLEWRRFEILCAELWAALGYIVEDTGAGADGGIDLKLYKTEAPQRLLIIVQAKSRVRENIGVAYVRELFGVMHHVNAPMGVLMTSAGFHKDARAFAQGKHIQLIGGEQILARLREFPIEIQQKILEVTTAGDFTTPTCPSCDVKMKRRPGRDGSEFWGCANFPRCRYTQAVRGAL